MCLSGCGAAEARLVWDQEAVSSNLTTPTRPFSIVLRYESWIAYHPSYIPPMPPNLIDVASRGNPLETRGPRELNWVLSPLV